MIGVLALALGAFVSLFVYKNLQGKGSSTVEAGADVIVAADDIQVGARVEDHDVRIARFPASGLPAGAYGKKSQVMGRGVIIPIAKGEFILPSKLAPENAGSGLPSLIPTGMRAVSVRVNEVVSVAGFVGPGTRVDVLLTGTPNGSSESQTTTVLTECCRNCFRPYSRAQCRRRSSEYPGDHAFGFSRRRGTADPCQFRRSHPALSAQPARYPSGSRGRSQCQGIVQRRHTSRSSAAGYTSRSPAQDSAPSPRSCGLQCRGL